MEVVGKNMARHDLPRRESKRVKSNTVPRHATHRMTTRSQTLTAARSAVFETTELFEAILLHLPLDELLAVRGVCSQWERVILHSPALRCALFLQPLAARDTALWALNVSTDTLREVPSIPGKGDKDWGDDIRLSRPSVLNPLLFSRVEPKRRDPLNRRAYYCEPVYFAHKPDLRRLMVEDSKPLKHGRATATSKTPSSSKPSGSLAKLPPSRSSLPIPPLFPFPTPLHPYPIHYSMFLTQPPARVVRVNIAYHRSPAQHQRVDKLIARIHRSRQERLSRQRRARATAPSLHLTNPTGFSAPAGTLLRPVDPSPFRFTADGNIKLTVDHPRGVKLGHLLRKMQEAILENDRSFPSSSKEAEPLDPSLRVHEALGGACVVWIVGAVLADEDERKEVRAGSGGEKNASP